MTPRDESRSLNVQVLQSTSGTYWHFWFTNIGDERRMISNRAGSQQSEFMQALVPMVDLFAVLAIVFMLHSNEEITIAQAEVQEARMALDAVDPLARARRERRELMADQATKTLDQIKEDRRLGQ